MKKYLHLFWTYLKISATTHGGCHGWDNGKRTC